MVAISAPLDLVVCYANAHHIEGGAEIPQENCCETSQLHPSKFWEAI